MASEIFSFLVKYRLVARNEKSGNYVMTVFLAGSPPTSSAPSSASLFRSPVKRRVAGAVFGTMRSRYHFSRILWPEVELNYTRFQDGPHNGAQQLFVTPGVIVGRPPRHQISDY
jgi:hypothetical protein